MLLVITAPLIGVMNLTTIGWGWGGIWLLIIVSLFVVDWRMSPKQGNWSLLRMHEERLSLATQNLIAIAVTLHHGQQPFSIWPRQTKSDHTGEYEIWLRDESPVLFHRAEESHLLQGRIAPRSTTTLCYEVYPPRRGDYQFGDLHLRWTSVLGLWHCQATFPASTPIKVYPNLVDVRKYDLLLRKNRLWELGVRNTRLRGAGTEFERLRDYQPDDAYRRINWKATARRGKPISIEYEVERSQNIVVLLDIGRMMRSPVGDVAKVDYAINAVLLLAYVAAQKGDKVGLLAFADDVQRWVAPQSGKAQFHRLLEQLYAVESLSVEPDYDRAFRYFATKQHKRSLVLLFTDLTGSISADALLRQVSRLRRSHLPLLVTMRDPTVQWLAQQPVVDSPTLYQRTVAEQLLDERRLALEQLTHRGILALDVPADQLSLAVINRYLALKAERRI